MRGRSGTTPRSRRCWSFTNPSRQRFHCIPRGCALSSHSGPDWIRSMLASVHGPSARSEHDKRPHVPYRKRPTSGLRALMAVTDQITTLTELIAGAGAPYALVVTAGLFFAPASHGSALTPGVMPLWVALLSTTLLSEVLPARRTLGLLLILCGVVAIAGIGVVFSQGQEWLGHVLFLTAALMWACYTIALRSSGLSALHGTAIVAVWSMLLYLPVYALFLEPAIGSAR